jgi:hypothetical protein
MMSLAQIGGRNGFSGLIGRASIGALAVRRLVFCCYALAASFFVPA